jgi:hypothetical protein
MNTLKNLMLLTLLPAMLLPAHADQTEAYDCAPKGIDVCAMAQSISTGMIKANSKIEGSTAEISSKDGSIDYKNIREFFKEKHELKPDDYTAVALASNQAWCKIPPIKRFIKAGGHFHHLVHNEKDEHIITVMVRCSG